MNILIADDDVDSRRLLQVMLEDLGHWVFGCRNGWIAWEVYKIARFPVVMFEWVMPGMSGSDLCHAIREADRHPRCTVVITISGNSAKDSTEIMAAGADGYLMKPILTRDLEAWVGAVD
ncbi:MAG TPA: response regulator [Blastocatellia bacterium]